MKRVQRALRAGLSAAYRNRRPILWLYLGTLLAALPLALGVGTLVHHHFGSRLAQDVFAEGLHPVLAADFIATHGIALRTMIPVFVGGLLLWGGMSTYLTGVVLMAVHTETPLTSGEVLAAGGRVVGRLIRLLLIAVPFFALTLGGPLVLVAWMGGSLLDDWTSERAVAGVRLGLVGGAAMTWVWAKATYDLMRVEAVIRGEYRARYAFVRGLRHGLLHPLEVLGLHLPYAVLAAGLTLGWLLVDVRMPRGGWWLWLFGVGCQQGVAWFREGIRVALAGSSVAYVRSLMGR